MTTTPPHLYVRWGKERGRDVSLLTGAVHQAMLVEYRNLPAILTLGHLAFRTGLSHSYLRSVVERKGRPYRSFAIEKRGRRLTRLISVPEPGLMSLQRWILDRILSVVPQSPFSFAYAQGRSAKGCAARHCGAEWLIKLDLHNFFHSIDERDVFRIFVGLGYQPLVSFELSRLCTRDVGSAYRPSRTPVNRYSIQNYSSSALGVLPQGAPTSGALANLSMHDLDARIGEMAASRNLVYTRYADDLTFSSSDKFSRTVAVNVISAVARLIQIRGLRVHRRKTQIITPGARKIVLGLLVDGAVPRLPKHFKTRIDSHLRGCEAFGLTEHRVWRSFDSTAGFVMHMNGLLSYALDIEPIWAQGRVVRWSALLRRVGLHLALPGLPASSMSAPWKAWENLNDIDAPWE